MKKLFLINILSICAMTVSAQLKVQNSDNVSVGAPSGTLLSKFTVGCLGDASTTAYISSSLKSYALKVTNNAGCGNHGVYAKATGITGHHAIGIQGEGQYNCSSCIGAGIGVRGMAGTPVVYVTRAYGVSGIIDANSTAGAGIYGGYGTAGTTNPEAIFQGNYAGYFAGNVYIAGTVSATNIKASDSRLKKNVLDLDYQRTLDRVMLLRPVEYNIQQVTFDADSVNENGDIVTYSVNRYNETTDVFQHKHYGLIAQEVQRIYPDLVYEGSDGYLGIDYVSLIPMMLKVMQQQLVKLEQQQVEIERLQRNESAQHNAPARPQEIINEGVAVLFQNTPNPFTENTEIAFYLPPSVTNAMLCVYDMNGKQLSQNVITQRGSSVFVVNGNQYGAGMYLYSLIADNQLVATKRMILTK